MTERPVRSAAPVLVGREAELAACREHLAGPGLVTVCGLGGIGKTALARALAGARECVFVELEHVPPDGSVAVAVLAAAGQRVVADVEPERVLRALRGRDVLVVLDNAEHVLAAVRRLAPVLAAELPVLVTSRLPLDVDDERVLELAGLDAAGRDSAAVRLFARRRRVVGELPDADAVLELCRLVDGHPLALELAAAQSRVRTPRELVRMVKEGRAPLGGGDLGRHRDLDHVLATTLALQGAADLALLRAVAVFAVGARADALAEVLGVPDDAELGTRLQRLLETGLLRARGDDAGTVLELHPLVREHVRRADLADLALRHAEWVARLAGGLETPVPTPAEAAFGRQLAQEALPAARVLAAAGRAGEGVVTLMAVSDAVSGYVDVRPLAEAIAALRPGLPEPLATRAAYFALDAGVRSGDLTLDNALRRVAESAAAAGEGGIRTEVLMTMARRRREAGDLTGAGELLDEAAALAATLPDEGFTREFDGAALRAYVARERAALIRAHGYPGYVDDVVAVLRAGDDPSLRPKPATSLRTRLAVALADAGDVEAGRRMLREMLGVMWPDMHVHQWLGWLLLRDPADLDAAERHLAVSAASYDDQGWGAWAINVETGLVVVRLRRGDHDGALALADELLARPTVPAATASVLRLARAQALRLRGDSPAAVVELDRVLADSAAPPVVRTGAYGERALLHRAAGDDDAACRDATAAVAGGLGGQPEDVGVALLHREEWRALARPPLPLTPRQLEALRAVSNGETVAAAARGLGISPKTLTKHLENVYAVLGVSSRIEALKVAGIIG